METVSLTFSKGEPAVEVTSGKYDVRAQLCFRW